MKRAIAIVCAVVFVCASALGSDNKKDESKPAPRRVVLTAEQVKLVRQVEEGLKELEREYRQQQAVINAQGAGILRVIAQQGGLGDKQYKLVPEGDGFALEEVVPETRRQAESGRGDAETRGTPGDVGTRGRGDAGTAPRTEAPKTEAPKTEQPKDPAPKGEAPQRGKPAASVPATQPGKPANGPAAPQDKPMASSSPPKEPL